MTIKGPLDPSWFSKVPMKRIILHWTAGHSPASEEDLTHYHFIVNQDEVAHKGLHSIADNVSTSDGIYAAHTLGCNTGSIGLSMAGMAMAQQSPFVAGTSPITEGQWEATIRAAAQLCQAYKILPDRKTLLSHAEVQNELGITQRGKWDVAILPWNKKFNTARLCGDEFRLRVKDILAS